MLCPRRVRVGVTEHLERALALAHRKLERLIGLRVGDRSVTWPLLLHHSSRTSIRSPVRPSSSRVMWVRGWVISLSSRVV